MVSNETLVDVVKRLENAILNLNKLGGQPVNLQAVVQPAAEEEEKVIIKPFSEFWNKTKNSLNEMVNAAEASDHKEELTKLTLVAVEGVCYQFDILNNQDQHKLPTEKEIQVLQLKLKSILDKISPITTAKRELDPHGQAVNYGLNCVYWVTMQNDVVDLVQQYSDMIDNHRNKILLKKIEHESKWVKSWKEIFANLLKLVKMEYKVGLPWNYKSTLTFDDFEKKIGETYIHYCETKTFDKKKVKALAPVTSQATSQDAPQKKATKNSDFIQLIRTNYGKIVAATKEANIDKLDALTSILGKAYSFLAFIIDAAIGYKLPSDDVLKRLGETLSGYLKQIKDIDSRDLQQFKDYAENMLLSFHWTTKLEQCLDVAQLYAEMMDGPGNKILMKKIPAQSDFIKANKQIVAEMIKLVKVNYKNGLEWNYKGTDNFDDLFKGIAEFSLESEPKANQSTSITYAFSTEGLIKSESQQGDAFIIEGLSNGRITAPKGASIQIIKSSNVEISFNEFGALISVSSDSSNLIFTVNGKQFKL